MSIPAINFGNKPTPIQNQTNTTTNSKKNDDRQTLRDEFAKEGINIPKLTPIQSGLVSGFLWFGTGILTDKLLGKVSNKFKIDTKISIIVASCFGVVSGVLSYIKAKKNEANDKN